MNPTPAEELLRRTDVTPLIRATRNQVEIDYLPPYGDPEVSIPGEIATYTVASAAVIAALEHLSR